MSTPNDPNEFFGAMPHRPDHPDFWKLSNVLLSMDQGLDPADLDEEAKDRAFKARIAEIGIDEQTLSYAATQRTFRALGITNSLQMLDPKVMHQVMLLSSVWIDAFAAGAFYERGDR